MGYLYGIPSERQIEQRIQTDVALRWYLGLDLFDSVPDHSTISQLRRRKPSFCKLFKRLFLEVVGQCVSAGLVHGKLITTDSTHVKAYASRASEYLKDVDPEPGTYWERLDGYEEQALDELKAKTGKPRGMHYLSHQSVDTDHGIILDVAVTSGETGDTVPYLAQIERIHREIIPIQMATADSIYDFALAHQVMGEHGISFFVRPKTEQAQATEKYKRDLFAYDQAQDCYVCPAGRALTLRNVTRSAHGVGWLYRAEKKDCQSCPYRGDCLSKSRAKGGRELTRSFFAPAEEWNKSRLDTAEYQQALKKRQIWSEGTFAAQKWGHNLTRVLRRGLEAAEDHCLLSATALNLKRMIRCTG